MSADMAVTLGVSDEIDFIAVWRVLWNYKLSIALITVLGTLAAVAVALTAVPIFRAEVVVTEAHDNHLGGAGSLAGQLGGLGAIAGVNLPSGSASRDVQAVLHSRHLVEEFIKRNGLLDQILPKSATPKPLWLAVQRFQQTVLNIADDARRGTTTVAIEWTDPVVCARWANDFVALANEIIRTRAMDESKRNISFLNTQIAQTNVVELRKVMYDLVESETKTLMLASGRVEYAFAVVDPAVPPYLRVRPRRAMIVLSGALLCFFAGAAGALARNRLRIARRTERSSE